MKKVKGWIYRDHRHSEALRVLENIVVLHSDLRIGLGKLGLSKALICNILTILNYE